MSAQSFYLISTIYKPTLVHNTSATLIDNIFTNDLEQFFVSGNIVSDLTDRFSQFCIHITRLVEFYLFHLKYGTILTFHLKILIMNLLKSIVTLLI